MDPKEALNILTRATGALECNRATHIKIQQALDVFAEMLIKPTPPTAAKAAPATTEQAK